VPTARRSRTIQAPLGELWNVICDPHHLPRWWPRVERVEDVDGRSFTEVMTTAKGKVVRADFDLVDLREGMHTLCWRQSVQGTPFERVLQSAETEIALAAVAPCEPAGGGEAARASAETHVTIELRQTLNGLFSRVGGYLVRRAAMATIEGALDGLERISG